MAAYGNATAERVAEINTDIAELTDELHAANSQVRIRLNEPAIRTLPPGRIEQERAEWLQQRRQAQQAAQRAAQERRKAQQATHSHEPYPSYTPTTHPGRGIGR